MEFDREVGQCNPGVFSVNVGFTECSGGRLEGNTSTFLSLVTRVVSNRLFTASCVVTGDLMMASG